MKITIKSLKVITHKIFVIHLHNKYVRLYMEDFLILGKATLRLSSSNSKRENDCIHGQAVRQ